MTVAGDKSSYLATDILRLVEESDVSVRLSNALHAASDLPLRTVGDYLAAGPKAREEFLRLPNLGKHSANELDRLVHDYMLHAPDPLPLKAPDQLANDNQPANPHTLLRLRLAALFAADIYPTIFLDDALPTRLATALESERHATRPLSLFFLNWRHETGEFFKKRNVGRHSIDDLYQLSAEIIRKRLKTMRLGLAEIDAALAILLADTEQPPAIAAAITHILDSAAEPLPEPPAIPLPLPEIIDTLIGTLETRSQDVLRRRYGFGLAEPETLEEVATGYKLTRERIRQIEAKAIRVLATAANRRKIQAAFDAEAKDELTSLHDVRGYFKDGELRSTFRALRPSTRLAIDILFQRREDALKGLATPWQNGWLLTGFDPRLLDDALGIITRNAAKFAFPNTLGLLTHGLEERIAETALFLGTQVNILDGYVTDRRAGRRFKRTIRLHRILAMLGRPQEIRELVAEYRRKHADDACSVRDAIIVMCQSPQLFLDLQEGVWTALGQTTPSGLPPSEIDASPPEDASEQDGDQSIRLTLRSILSARGPLRFVDIRSAAVDVLGAKSSHSIGPILLTSGEFVRPLPGVYGLPDQVRALRNIALNPPDFLLTEDQARWIAMARFAGEPFGSYPLWGPESEYALCRWSEHHASPATFQSLLATASIKAWPVSKPEIDHWLQQRDRLGNFALAASPRYPLHRLWPPLHRVLAAMVLAQVHGGLNWMICNRLLKTRLDSHASAGLLAVVALLGVVTPPAHWQRLHMRHHGREDIVDALTEELRRQGRIKWGSDAGRRVIDALLTAASPTPHSWLTPAIVAELRSVAGGDLAEELEAPPESNDDAVLSFDKLLAEVSQQEEALRARENINTALLRPVS